MANIFPRWTNILPLQIAICLGFVAFGVAAAVTYYATPKATRVGYQPDQPIPFDHALHAGQLGLDCRYCHSHVDVAGHSNIPGGNTCWNCHQHVQKDSDRLTPLHRAMNPDHPEYTGDPVRWVRVHRAPDYVQFDHSAHVNSGVSCVSCHGKVNEMRVVYHAESHSMSWCLDCHREPEKHLRPLEEVYNMDYDAVEYLKANEVFDKDGERITTQLEFGEFLREHWAVHPKTSCATCHH